MQQEFCFFDAAVDLVSRFTVAMGMCRLTIEASTSETQLVTLRNQIVKLLTTLKHSFNRLMQSCLGLVQLALDVGKIIRLLRLVVLLHDLHPFWVLEGWLGVNPRRPWVLSDEVFENLVEERVCCRRGVASFDNDYADEARCGIDASRMQSVFAY